MIFVHEIKIGAVFETLDKFLGTGIIQSADENFSTLLPRHLPLANQCSLLEEERADLIGVAESWGVMLFAQGHCIFLACMAACYGFRGR